MSSVAHIEKQIEVLNKKLQNEKRKIKLKIKDAGVLDNSEMLNVYNSNNISEELKIEELNAYVEDILLSFYERVISGYTTMRIGKFSKNISNESKEYISDKLIGMGYKVFSDGFPTSWFIGLNGLEDK